jgi:hypothetical protein
MMSTPGRPRLRIWPILIPATLVLSGCGVFTPVTTPGPAPTPVVAISTFVPTDSPADGPLLRPSSTPSSAPTREHTASPPACPGPPVATSLYCATKNDEGGHGGPPVLDLPEAIAMDYWVSGTCVFSLGLSAETSASGLPSLTMTISGPAVSGTWRARLKPGRYYPAIGDAVGCVFSVNIRDDRKLR